MRGLFLGFLTFISWDRLGQAQFLSATELPFHALPCACWAYAAGPCPFALSSFHPFSAFIALGLVAWVDPLVAWVDPLSSGLWDAGRSWLAFGLFIGFLPWGTLAVLRLCFCVYNYKFAGGMAKVCRASHLSWSLVLLLFVFVGVLGRRCWVFLMSSSILLYV